MEQSLEKSPTCAYTSRTGEADGSMLPTLASARGVSASPIGQVHCCLSDQSTVCFANPTTPQSEPFAPWDRLIWESQVTIEIDHCDADDQISYSGEHVGSQSPPTILESSVDIWIDNGFQPNGRSMRHTGPQSFPLAYTIGCVSDGDDEDDAIAPKTRTRHDLSMILDQRLPRSRMTKAKRSGVYRRWCNLARTSQDLSEHKSFLEGAAALEEDILAQGHGDGCLAKFASSKEGKEPPFGHPLICKDIEWWEGSANHGSGKHQGEGVLHRCCSSEASVEAYNEPMRDTIFNDTWPDKVGSATSEGGRSFDGYDEHLPPRSAKHDPKPLSGLGN